jgi:protein-tyrosine phosphatase
MIDLHCHILPGVDDGPQDWPASLEMMTMAASAGTTVMVATPHSHDGWRGGAAHREIRLLSREAERRARQAGLALEILPGNELYIQPGLPAQLRAGSWLTLGRSCTVLLELPFSIWPRVTEALIFELQVEGYTVLLAHPERYHAVIDNPNLLLNLVERGVYIQVTTTSITGLFGAKVRETARLLVEHDLCHVLASDSHTAGRRHPRLDEAHAILCEWIGEEAANRLVWANPRALLNDEPPDVPAPRPVERTSQKKLFGLF